ncbi:MAG: thiamine diphosphokinase [Spirochaetales bacterium]|nr:thiamine diphosphokinase [Spirochaetales bacterium]
MESGKRGLLITGGLAAGKEWLEYIKDGFDLVAAADSGIETAVEMGAQVDYAVGDMDSLSDARILEKFKKESIVKFEQDKDYTDTELGLSVLKDNGCGFRCIYGGGGGRLDHLLGIFSLFDRDDGPDLWITESAVIAQIRDTLVLNGMKGSIVSFFPAGVVNCTMVSYGLKWQLDGLEWSKGDAGVSNVVTEDSMRVTIRTGKLVFVGALETLKGLSL